MTGEQAVWYQLKNQAQDCCYYRGIKLMTTMMRLDYGRG